MRATTSTPEPAGKPISTVIGLAGQSSAKAEAAERKNASEASRAFNMDVSGGTASWLLCWGNGGRNAMGYMTEERRLIQETARAAQERRQFGQAIGEFQNTRFRLARMATEIEAARQLMYFVCDEIDQKRRCDKEAAMVK